jgi:thiamine pyrophosphokinase
MNRPIVQSLGGITLVGGGPVSPAAIKAACVLAPVLVAADGGADRCLRAGMHPAAVIGDFDSMSAPARGRLDPATLHHIPEQSTTDFDKALRSVAAPFVLALGFTGARIDHQLAVFNVLVRRVDPVCIVVGARDVVFHAPRRMALQMRVGERFSLFPMGPVTGRSQGLEWAIDGLHLTPAGQTSTSNRVSAARVVVETDGPGLLVILPRARLGMAINALVPQASRLGGRGH